MGAASATRRLSASETTVASCSQEGSATERSQAGVERQRVEHQRFPRHRFTARACVDGPSLDGEILHPLNEAIRALPLATARNEAGRGSAGDRRRPSTLDAPRCLRQWRLSPCQPRLPACRDLPAGPQSPVPFAASWRHPFVSLPSLRLWLLLRQPAPSTPQTHTDARLPGPGGLSSTRPRAHPRGSTSGCCPAGPLATSGSRSPSGSSGIRLPTMLPSPASFSHR